MAVIVQNGMVFLDGGFEKKDILLEGGVFTKIAEPGQLDAGQREKERCLETEHGKEGGTYPAGEPGKENLQVIDAVGNYILPGLVDIHTHGRAGEDFSLLAEGSLERLCASYAACGVTSVVGTTMTNRTELVEESIYRMGRYMQQENPEGARLLGIHMEGPFLGQEKKGAHDAAYFRLPDISYVEKLQELCGGTIRLLTMDPLLSGAEELIQYCRKQGIRVSLGHTACDYDTAIRMRRAGADHVTHLFNAMNPLHHRKPGLAGAALDTGMYAELICDGFHLHPAIIRLMFAACPERMVLISDSMPAAGLSDGAYSLGGLKVLVKEGKAVQEDGTIAGSTVSLYEAMVQAIRFGIPKEIAVNSATRLPAEALGLENVAGSIGIGRRADFLVVTAEWNLEQVFLGGRVLER